MNNMEEDFTLQRLYKQNKVQQRRIKELEAALVKSQKALLNWNPDDHFVPEVKKQFDKLMEEIEQVLEGDT